MSPKINGGIAFAPWDWWIGAGFFSNDIEAEFRNGAEIFGGLLLLGIALLGALALQTIRGGLKAHGGDLVLLCHKRSLTQDATPMSALPAPKRKASLVTQ